MRRVVPATTSRTKTSELALASSTTSPSAASADHGNGKTGSGVTSPAVGVDYGQAGVSSIGSAEGSAVLPGGDPSGSPGGPRRWTRRPPRCALRLPGKGTRRTSRFRARPRALRSCESLGRGVSDRAHSRENGDRLPTRLLTDELRCCDALLSSGNTSTGGVPRSRDGLRRQGRQRSGDGTLRMQGLRLAGYARGPRPPEDLGLGRST